MAFKIDKGILGAFLMLLGLVGLIGGLFFLQYIYGIVLGSVFQTVQTGGLNVTVATELFLNNTESDFFTTIGYVNTGAKFAGTLITVAVILIIFGAFLTMGRKGKKGKNDDDMGY